MENRYVQFHYITHGKCVIKIAKGPTMTLAEGDLLLVFSNNQYWIANSIHDQRLEATEVIRSIRKSGFNKQSQFTFSMVWGHFEFDKAIAHPFVKTLPPYIHLSQKEIQEFTLLKTISELLIEETNNDQSGSQAIANRLAEVLFIGTMRAYAYTHSHDHSFITALLDERINKVLNLIHESPEKKWTLVILSKKIGVSRTTLATTFKEKVGQSVLEYITTFRIMVAKNILIETKDPVAVIAENVGYGSEPSFNRVFKKIVKQTPSRFRKNNT